MVLPPNLNMRPEWVTSIERQLREAKAQSSAAQRPVPPLDIFKQFLVSDLRQSCQGSLPENLDIRSTVAQELRGSFVLQVENWSNICVDEETRQKEVSADKLDGQGGSARRTLLLSLSDGCREISALEAEPLPKEVNVALKKYAIPGLKLVVKGGIVRYGTMLLTSNSVRVLGGPLASAGLVGAAAGASAPAPSRRIGQNYRSEGSSRVGTGSSGGTGSSSNNSSSNNNSSSKKSNNNKSSSSSSSNNSSSNNSSSNNNNKSSSSSNNNSSSNNSSSSSNASNSTNIGSNASASARSISRSKESLSNGTMSHQPAQSENLNALSHVNMPPSEEKNSSPSADQMATAEDSKRPSSSPSSSISTSSLGVAPFCSSIKEWISSRQRSGNSKHGSVEKVRVQGFVSGIESGSHFLLRLDDGKHLTKCFVSHSFHCQMLDLDPVTTTQKELRKTHSNRSSKAKIAELVSTLRGIFELSKTSTGAASQDVPVIESFRTTSAGDIEELKTLYKRLERKRKIH